MKRIVLSTAILAFAGVISAEDSRLILEEVIVTAQKKAESLQDTPISLTAFSDERLEIDGVASLNDIASSVPSMAIEPFPLNNTTLRIFIRGVGLNDAQITQDAPVGIYQDGAYIARSTGLAMDVADLERIEVLRGPQGTLYGRNSTGGTVNLITKRPETDALSLKQTFRVGNFGYFSSKSTLNLPVTQTFAIKLGYLFSEKDGFVENNGPGGDFGERESQGWRLDARWELSDSFRVDYSYDHSEIEFFNQTFQPVTPRPVAVPDPSNPGSALAAGLQNSAQSRVSHSEDRWSEAKTAVPLLPSETETDGHMLTLTWDYSDALQVKYIGAVRELEDIAYYDQAGGGGFDDFRLDNNTYTTKDGSVTYPLALQPQTQDQVSHELQFSGLVLDERLEYIAGLYYFREEADETRPFGHLLSAPIAERTVAPGVVVKTSLLNLVAYDYEIENSALAVFGRATWTPDVLDGRLHVTLGARHSEDGRKAVKYQRSAVQIEAVTSTASGDSTSPPTPVSDTEFLATGDRDFRDNSLEFVAAYDAMEDINVYIKSTEAYKSGGYNVRDPDEARFKRGFDAEKVASIELGIKSELLERRLRLNADVFRSDYTDMQLNFLINNSIAQTQVINAGEAEMKGLELDMHYLLSRSLLLSLNYAYLDAEVTSATDPDTGADVTDDFTFGSAPEHSYTASLDYTVVEWNRGRVALNLSYNYMGERNGAVRTASVPDTRMEDYDLINARVGLYDVPLVGGSFTAALWGRNLADTEYVISAFDGYLYARRAALWGEPRSYGLDLIYRY